MVGALKPLAGQHRAQRRFARATSPICRRSPRSTAPFRSTSTTWWRWGCGGSAGLFGGIGRKERERIERAIAAVGLTGFEQRAIGTLSGGQMQRMLFARLLLQDARLIVLDEPFNAIDAKTSADLLDLVRRWHSEERTVLAALHDIDLVRGEFPRDAAARARAGGLGRDRRCADAGKSAEGAAHVRGLRRAQAAECAAVTASGRHVLRHADRARSPNSSSCAARSSARARWRSAPAPIGVFLMLRRMSLVGDAMAHAILPGAAIGFLLSGLNLFAMTAGGLIAGFVVALARRPGRALDRAEGRRLACRLLPDLARARRDHRLGAAAPISICCTSCSARVLALDDQTLILIAVNATVTLLVLALIYRPLVLECVDPGFLRSVSRAGAPAHLAFLALVVINLVSGFHALGTLLAVGIMMLPAAIGALLGARHHGHDR